MALLFGGSASVLPLHSCASDGNSVLHNLNNTVDYLFIDELRASKVTFRISNVADATVGNSFS